MHSDKPRFVLGDLVRVATGYGTSCKIVCGVIDALGNEEHYDGARFNYLLGGVFMDAPAVGVHLAFKESDLEPAT